MAFAALYTSLARSAGKTRAPELQIYAECRASAAWKLPDSLSVRRYAPLQRCRWQSGLGVCSYRRVKSAVLRRYPSGGAFRNRPAVTGVRLSGIGRQVTRQRWRFPQLLLVAPVFPPYARKAR